MDSARCNTQVTIERRVATQDADTGRDIVTWLSIAVMPGSPSVPRKLWAEVMDVLPSRDESQRQGVEIGARRTRIRLQYRTDVDSSMRVTVHRDGDTVYQIVGGPSVIGHKDGIELLCEKWST